MMKKKYTNKELAVEYFRLITQYCNDLGTYMTIKAAIEAAEIDIHSLHQKKGNLKNLKVTGLGRKTKDTLELILDKGVEEAEKIIGKEKMDKIRREQFKNPSAQGLRPHTRGDGDNDPAFENIVRHLEND